MEILNSYSGNSGTGFHSARYTNLIDLDYNFKFLGEVFRVDDLLDFTNEELAPPIGDSGVKKDGQGEGEGEEVKEKKVKSKVKAEEGGEEEDEEEEEEEGDEEEEEEEEEEADDIQDGGLTGTVDVEVSKEEELELIGNMHCDIPELEWLSSFVDDPSSIDHETDGGGAGAAAVKYAGTAYPFKSTARDYREFRDEVINVNNSDHHHHQQPTSRLITSTSTTSAWKDSSRRSSSGGYMDMVPAASVRGRSRSKRARGGTNTKLWYSTSAAAPSSSTSSGNSENSNFSNTSEGQVEDTSTTNLRVQQQCCSSSFSAEESDGGGYDNEDLDEFIMPARPVKKVCKGKKQDTSQLQKCLHCGSQKTPQWRTGPLGPKTLCNACGVRFKSGRLFPEYRPAASPSFIPQKHSNSHKKVLEMRRMKESDKSTTTTTTTTRSTTTTTGTTSTDDEAGF